MEQKRKSLIEKYNIPLSHLDFEYVKKCGNAREMEKIVNILRSGEEGFYPDLTRCAEDKLKELKPNSQLFRYEEPIQRSEFLDIKELKPIYDWTHDIKSKDSTLNEMKQDIRTLKANLPPMRTPSKIDTDKSATEAEPAKPIPSPSVPTTNATKSSENRIKSTDYNKWDKYDPDVEILRMDLDEERAKEQAEQKNLKNVAPPKKEDDKTDDNERLKERLMSRLDQLSKLERDHLAEKHRLRGNEYFKSKEYKSAIEEYSQAIIYDPENASRSYNNRAISHLKVKNYLAAISDCEACLEIEPDNIKALLRLADANYGQGRRRESHDVYQRVLQLDPSNACALKSLEELHKQLGEIAPAHATRLTIEELPPEIKPKPKANPKASPKMVEPKTTKPSKDYDLAELVKPNRLVKNKILNASDAFVGKESVKQQSPIQKLTDAESSPAMLRMPLANNRADNNKTLIEEL
ncbi:sperm-associated antigen 1 [Drosophila tropicalis]|uniref:sperm-associated antigen 1 n=1 Tax=Drosophila tropicalis TaxID=46794 RepID=UPI0035AB9AAE